MPAPFAAGDREPLSGGEVDVDRAEKEVAAPTDRPVEGQHVVGEAGAAIQRQPQLPGLERLLRKLVPLEETLRLPHFRLERMCRAPILSSRLVPE